MPALSHAAVRSEVKDKGLAALVCVALAVAALAVFWGARQCGFVNFDDPLYVTSNDAIQHGFTARSVRWAFQTGEGYNWHPLTWFSHIADVDLYGMNPAGHHLTSVFLHAINGALLFLILRRMTGATWRSAFVAALFALHPLRVESVVWVSERKDVLSTLFWMLTVWAYVRYADPPSPRLRRKGIFYGLSLLFFALGLMSKPMLVTLPFILLLLDYWPLGRLQRSVTPLITEKIPYFMLAAASSVVTFLFESRVGGLAPLEEESIGARLANAVVSYARYLGKIFWPARLSPLYPRPAYWPWWEVAAAAALLAVITAWVIRRARAQPYLAVGWFWFLLMLAPVIGLVQVGIQSMADRYSYMASVGVFIMLAWGACDRMGRQRWILGAVAAMAIGACAVLTPRQLSYWRSSETLFLHAIEVTDNNYLAFNNLGADLINRGEKERAMLYLHKALDIDPDYADAHRNLALALALLGQYQQASKEYLTALSLNPRLTDAHNGLCRIYLTQKNFNGALQEALAAVQISPAAAEPLLNAAKALAGLGRKEEAVRYFEACLDLRPDLADTHNEYGIMLAADGDLEPALRQFQAAVLLAPNDAQVHSNLGAALAKLTRMREAELEFRAAMRLNPDDAHIHINLAVVLAQQGKRQEAMAQLGEAIRLRPNDTALKRQLEALSRQGP